MTPGPTPQQRKQARLRYYALGRFVQEFEWMVNMTRSVSLALIPSLEFPHDDLKVLMILNHQSMTAAPLLQVLRGLLGESIRYKKFEDDREDRLISLLRQIGREHEELVSARNTILHGTWQSNPQDLSLEIYNFRGSLPGGLRPAPVVNTAKGFAELARRCRRLAKLIAGLTPTARQHDFDPGVVYEKVGGTWRLRKIPNTSPLYVG